MNFFNFCSLILFPIIHKYHIQNRWKNVLIIHSCNTNKVCCTTYSRMHVLFEEKELSQLIDIDGICTDYKINSF